MNHVIRPLPFLLAAQLSLVVGGGGTLLLAPPAEGAMLMIPLNQDARHGLAGRALAHGGRLIAQGSVPGSFVVHGERARLAEPGVLLLAASSRNCSPAERRAR